ncbi:helix-turn-helix domain-containing protein [Phytoactinopolyspora limicola]|uniref:helix-turn-helix domain-containing protein n=1 Tax=Phytoactinopolyspora limicola TaxID=2715536 RepID=UPI00140D7C96|nr:XRE family transcriptional regulator [Phytoactinopolyspora limicola]
MSGDIDRTLTDVGPRLRALRLQSELTLGQLAEVTGISLSTLSRLESGQRRPTLELLLPLARAHQVSLDELVDAPDTGDPRINAKPITRGGMTFVPLTRQLGHGLQAFKQIIPGVDAQRAVAPETRVHEGYEWLYVLSGRLRLVLGSHDLVLGPGEAAEFDTRVPHGIAAAGPEPVEVLNIYGPQGERIHVRARPKPSTP